MWRIRSQFVELLLEPGLELVGRDRHARIAADGELKHVSIIGLWPLARYGYRPPSRVAQMGHPGGRWWLWRIPRRDRARQVSEATNSDPRPPNADATRSFLDFHRAAESAGYPALLIVSMVSLGAVVAPLVLLALTGAGWLLGVTLLGLIAAIALLAGEFNAAVSDGDERP